MTKQELVILLESILQNVKEGVVPPVVKPPYIVFWEIDWEFQTSSDEVYNDVVTYQVSFFSDIPRHPKLLLLMSKLRKLKIFPNVKHEYVDDLKCLHSAFTLEVIEDLLNGIET